MRIGIVGAGSIGCFVGGKLLATNAADVVLVGRPRVRDEIAAHGLIIDDGTRTATITRIETEVAAVRDCDAVLVCVKSMQTADVAGELAGVLRDGAIVASLQNGVRNADVLREALQGRTVIAGIVGFNVRSRGAGVFQRATSGGLMLERLAAASELADTLARAGLGVQSHADLARHQWTKLLVNLNNAVSALSNAPTAELIGSPGYRRVMAATIREALRVLRAAGIRPAPLRGVPVGLMPWVLGLPTPLVRLLTRAQGKVDPDARSSMWEDLAAGRPTEVDYLNGEIVRLAGGNAPINRHLVALVHLAEGTGSPALDAQTLWSAVTASLGTG